MNVHPVLKIISWSIVHAMKCVIKTTEILVGAVWYLSHMKEQGLPVCEIVSSQCTFGRVAAVYVLTLGEGICAASIHT